MIVSRCCIYTLHSICYILYRITRIVGKKNTIFDDVIANSEIISHILRYVDWGVIMYNVYGRDEENVY